MLMFIEFIKQRKVITVRLAENFITKLNKFNNTTVVRYVMCIVYYLKRN